ncbi:serine hydrolase domain-containing protein [Pseudaquidulcibacter saccharophilus]|uniref:serine hydrolase domain-containing protein n=1 Tax=Pseudaquidulcibacter saccharophilus TaxID=2831900 RepID=UPI001EFF569B|nr:serine hydrolase [Pseudaquidulcibacter saccharophilus]
MKKSIIALGICGIILIGAGAFWFGLDDETRGVLKTLPTNKDVLLWSQQQRDATFRAFDRLTILADHHTMKASSAPMPLPIGKPLNIPNIDEYMKEQRTAGIVIIQDGKIRFEKYGLGFDAKGRWTSFSVAKSFTSTLVGAAIKDGYIKSLDDNITDYMPDLKGSAYEGVSVRQLLTMSSGAAWNEDYEDKNSDVNKFNNAKPQKGVDATISYLKTLKRAHEPGTVWHYNTGETNLIGVLVASATHKNLADYLHEKIWQPYGMEADGTWLLGATGREIAGCCIQAATRDFARFGQFVMGNGVAGGKQVVPEDWFKQATVKQMDIGKAGHGYGFQWWTYDDGSFAAKGIFGQGIFIDPKRKLVIASNSSWPRASLGEQPKAREEFYKQIQELVDRGE